jgi:hypothetical protein
MISLPEFALNVYQTSTTTPNQGSVSQFTAVNITARCQSQEESALSANQAAYMILQMLTASHQAAVLIFYRTALALPAALAINLL